MDYNKIKEEVEECYNLINESTIKLEKIRDICDHPETKEVDYEWRIGSFIKAHVCVYCEKFIRQSELSEFELDVENEI